MRTRAKVKPRRAPDDDGDPDMMTPEEIRRTLVRQIARVLDRWRQCPARVCRRARRCASPALECTMLPSRSVTPQNDAAQRAHLYKMVKRRLAEQVQGAVPPGLVERRNAGGRRGRCGPDVARALPSARPKATPGDATGGSDRPSSARR